MHPLVQALSNFVNRIKAFLLHDKLGLATVLALFTLATPVLAVIYNVFLGVAVLTVLKAVGLSLASLLVVYFAQPFLGHILNPLVHFYVEALDKMDLTPLTIDGVGEVKVVPQIESPVVAQTQEQIPELTTSPEQHKEI